MRAVAEVVNSTYDDSIQRIRLLTALKNVQEVNPPSDFAPGTPVDGLRWIRQIKQQFTSDKLEVQSEITVNFNPTDVELHLKDVSRLPNNGELTINRGSATEEVVAYTGKDVQANKLLGVSSPINSHFIGEHVYPSVAVNFLGTFEVDLQYPPVRYNHTTVTLNGVKELLEGIDFYVVNDFVGNVGVRSRLRFEKGGEPRRFQSSDFLEVEYQFFDQSVGSVQIHVTPTTTAYVDIYEFALYEEYFGQLSTPDRDIPARGTMVITPPFSATILPPVPVKVLIRDIVMPVAVLTQSIAMGATEIPVSDVSRFPVPDTFLDLTDDVENRKITIDADVIYYTNVDTVNSKLVGITGVTTSHDANAPIIYDGARLNRDVVKDAINRSNLKGQIDAISNNVGGWNLIIKSKVSGRLFSLQPGTYALFFLGFNDDTDRGLNDMVLTSTPFENKDMTFSRYSSIVERRGIASQLLGETVSRQDVLTPPSTQ